MQWPQRKEYGLPLKWELHTDGVTWGETYIHLGPLGLTLSRKGATHALEQEGLNEAMCEWDKWVSVDSANARFTINSYLPSLFLKSVWYAASSRDIIANFRSIAWGVGAKKYSVEWWSPQLKKFLSKHKLAPYQSLADG